MSLGNFSDAERRVGELSDAVKRWTDVKNRGVNRVAAIGANGLWTSGGQRLDPEYARELTANNGNIDAIISRHQKEMEPWQRQLQQRDAMRNAAQPTAPQTLQPEKLPDAVNVQEIQTRQLPQFEAMRRRAEMGLNAQAQTANDALQRRLASMGALNSGAALKQQSLLGDQIAKQRESMSLGLDAQEAQERARLQEAAEGRQFAGTQNAMQRNMSREMAGFDREFANRGMSLDNLYRLAGLDMQDQQARDARETSAMQRRLMQAQMDEMGGGGFLSDLGSFVGGALGGSFLGGLGGNFADSLFKKPVAPNANKNGYVP